MENPRRIENELNAESLVLETGGCRIFAQQPRWVVFDEKAPSNGWHVHSVYEACLCLRGRGSFLCGSETAAFGPGDIFLGSPGLPHQITKEGAEETELFFFVFRPEREGRGDGSAEGELLRRFLEEGCPILAKGGPGALFFSDWFRAARGGTHAPAFRAMETTLLLECLGALVGSAGERTQERLAIDYIAAHLRERIAVPELARLLSLSERGCLRLFPEPFRRAAREIHRADADRGGERLSAHGLRRRRGGGARRICGRLVVLPRLPPRDGPHARPVPRQRLTASGGAKAAAHAVPMTCFVLYYKKRLV